MCDTFVALQTATADGSVIFGKNSDREPNEAMALEFIAGRSHPAHSRLKCTYVEIPQVHRTQDILICRPFWMWGAEMGGNQKGLVIGNEAVFTRMPANRGKALTGMDLLRLALERAGTAEEAVEVVVGLLADHGQGGICGYTDRRMAYHNSFLMADPGDAWVLETAGDLWAARRITDTWAISNRLTLDADFDRSHPQLIDTARQKGWLKRNQRFSFKGCYSDWFNTTFSFASTRRDRCLRIVDHPHGMPPEKFDLPGALNILRDHDTSGYNPASHLFMDRVCMHAANPVSRGFQTTGSLAAHLKGAAQTFWATGTAAPCTGIFKPLRFDAHGMPEPEPQPGSVYDERCRWWRHERLHRRILMDYGGCLPAFAEERDALEGDFLDQFARLTDEKKTISPSRAIFDRADNLTRTWTEHLLKKPVKHSPGWTYRRYWQSLNTKAQMPNS